jgi:signal transduction histidine kinase
MQAGFKSNNEWASEFAVLEVLISEFTGNVDQYALPVNAIRKLRDHLSASEVVFILFDPKNPGWAYKKLLGSEQGWSSESAFLIKESLLCNSITENITFINYDDPASKPAPGGVPLTGTFPAAVTGGSNFRIETKLEPDPVLFANLTSQIRNVIVAPLHIQQVQLGAMVFTNPAFDFEDKAQLKFLQLVIKGLSHAIHAAARNRELIVNNADLEATHWQILNSRNTLRTFFDNLPSSVYIVDRSYTIIAINSRRAERTGRKPQELVGGKCYETLCGTPGPCASCRVKDALNGIPSVHTLKELGPNETFIHWEITTVPIREDANTINQVIVFEEDVTEKWILEANLIRSEKMASIGQLAANVAHEINNPLAAIIANAQLLMRDLSHADEDTIESLKLIETAGNRAAKIVSNLLDSARREKNYEFEEFSLNQSILDAVSMLNFEIKNRSVNVKLHLKKEMPDIFAHKNQLKGVWINLIMNALGAMENQKGTLTISTSYQNQEYRVVFTDSGKGIPPEHQERIFEPFFTTKGAGKGTGLGLYVSLQIIKEHHGDMQFVTKPGKGTKFIVTLPEAERTEIDPNGAQLVE